MALRPYSGLAGVLFGYSLNIIYNIDSTLTAHLTMRDNFSSLSILKSYGFTSNNLIVVSIPYNWSDTTAEEIWPLNVPSGTSFTTNAANLDPTFNGSSCITPNINGNPLPVQGILNYPTTYYFNIGNPNYAPIQCGNNVFIQVNTSPQLDIQPITFVLNNEYGGDSYFINPEQITINQILTVTLPVTIGSLTLIWSLTLLQPNGTSITPVSGTDQYGNYTAWLPNIGPGNYTLTAANNTNWSTSITYSVSSNLTSTKKSKYRKLIKRSNK